MIRPATTLLLAASLAVAAMPGFARTAETPHQSRRAAKPQKAAAPTVAPRTGSIATPATDFSTIERADQEPGGPDGPTFRPTMGAGGMGVGGAF